MDINFGAMTDEEVMEKWKQATAWMNSAYKELQVYLSTAQYKEQQKKGFMGYKQDFTEAELRKRFWMEAARCQQYSVEARMRGLVTDADWLRRVRR